jgi:GntR family histidine utilization transcriptional repressor
MASTPESGTDMPRRASAQAVKGTLGGAAAPLYRQAKDYVISNIASGTWPPDQKIVSEHELAKLFGISRMTANRAMAELASEGHIVRITGVGSFVAPKKPHGHLFEIHNIADEIAERGHRHSCSVLAHEHTTATQDLAVEFDVQPGVPLFHSLVVHFENDSPLQLEDRYVSPRVAPKYLEWDLSRRTANEYLTQVAPLARAQHVVSAIMPPRRVAKPLKMRDDEPCLLVHRTTWSEGRVASVANLYHPGSRYDLVGRFSPPRRS